MTRYNDTINRGTYPTLLDFSRDDQQALLEVVADYFTSPIEGRDSDNDEDGTTDNQQAASASLRTTSNDVHSLLHFVPN